MPFRTRYADKNFQELAFEATKAALDDARLTKNDIQSAVYAIYSDMLMRQQTSDCLVHDYLGLSGKPGLRVTAGASTGAFAFRAAYAEIMSGLSDVVLLLAVQKSGDLINAATGHRGDGIMMSESITHDVIWQHPYTPFPPAAWGLALTAHIARYGGPTPEQCARAALKNHRNAHANPNAQFKLNLTLEDILNSRLIAWPTTMYECCPFSEGAAAVVLAADNVAPRITKKPVWVGGVGTSVEGGTVDMSDEWYGRLPALHKAAQAAYHMAGVSDPKSQLDVLEVHDIISGLELLAYEELGLCEPGECGKMIDSGVVEKSGALPVNPSGGRVACGHIAGPSEVFSVGEVALQLRSDAGGRQVPIRRGRGLVSTIGGPAASVAGVIVLEQDKP
ncbi:MAG: thiolase family protein [Chloroflexi bacterium]|nr:thiolase family protein [Chloroflexota bacterium]